MPKVQPRDVSPILQRFRAFLLGRELTPTLRFEENVASRSPPPPNIPDGPCHGLSKNYYFTRDVRREVQPPTAITSKKTIEAGKSDAKASPKKLPTPGKIYLWD